jgi:hypothetical protein
MRRPHVLKAHEARLNKAFGVLLLSMAAPAVLQVACGGDSSPSASPDGAAADAHAPDSGNGQVDATTHDVVADTRAEAMDDSPLDAGADAMDAADTTPRPCQDASDVTASAVCGDAAVHGEPYSKCGSLNECYYFVDYSCPAFSLQAGCYLSGSDCAKACDDDSGFVFDCEYAARSCSITFLPDGSAAYTLSDAGPYTIQCGLCPGVGRRPAGLVSRKPRAACGALGRHFAESAYLEAASVLAFERLERELEGHGAPHALRRAARRSARDEVRHARVMSSLARRFGGAAPSPRVRRSGVRTLERVARENAVEGCVRETFGALIASWQAAHAGDPVVQAHMRRIAVDETRHAALSWAVDEWAQTRLSPAARSRVARARLTAVARLREEWLAAPPESLQRTAGLPGAADAQQMLAALERDLWAQSSLAPC